jgi:hypothetical protein
MSRIIFEEGESVYMVILINHAWAVAHTKESKEISKNNLWLLGFEPRSPRPQRVLTTKLQPLCVPSALLNNNY